MPWGNVNQIQVTFSEAVNVSQASLTLTGVVGGTYAFSNFSYNPTTLTATWTLANPIGADRLNIVVHATGAGAVTDTSGDALDGEWTNGVSTYPSGDGTAGGDFNFAFNVLPGDANQDGIVNSQDIAFASSSWLGGGPVGDTNADGIINSQDLALIASNWLAKLPAAAGPSASTATADVATLSSSGQSQPTTGVLSGSVSTLTIGVEQPAAPANASHPALDRAVLTSIPTSFVGPLRPDRVAAFVGKLEATPAASLIDRVFSQPVAGSGDSNGSNAHGNDGDTVSSSSSPDDDLFASTIDDELLSLVATGGRFGKSA